MKEELIKRIDMMMCEKVPVDEEAERTQNFDLYILLQDCRAALTKKYVPMTDTRFNELKQKWIDGKVTFDWMLRSVETEVIRRAGLEVQE